MNLGSVIKTCRKKRNISAKNFSLLCQISETQLSHIENQGENASIHVLLKMAYQLDVPLPILFIMAMDERDIFDSSRYSEVFEESLHYIAKMKEIFKLNLTKNALKN